jgi:hypothetical protein
MKFAVSLLPFLILASSGAGAAEVIDQKVIALHQRCVFQAFAQAVERARQFEPGLLDKSVGECESILRSLKSQIINLTHDPAFADEVLAKVREASRKGVAVAVITDFGRGN